MYTIRQLIDANRRALVDRTLGALHHVACAYTYDDGCRCAIGAVFDDATLGEIEANHQNTAGITRIVRNGYAVVENLDVFENTQDLHDAWARRARYFLTSKATPSETFPKELYDFLFRLQNQFILESNYTQWLDLLDKHFPQTPVEAA